MSNKLFRGDSPPVSQVTKITPANVLIGDSFTVTCNGKSVTYVALANTAADVVAGLVAAISASTIPEFSEMLASAASDNSYLTLTAATPGVPFTVTTSSAVTTAGQITVVETTKGVTPVNEFHQIALVGTYSGGTFTITYNVGAGNVTTGNIAYNAAASAVQTALTALTGVGAGNVVVTGGPGPNTPWLVQWTGTLGGQAIAVGTVNGTNLTGNGGVSIAETQHGSGTSTCLQFIDFSNCFPIAGSGSTYTLSFGGQTTTSLASTDSAATIQTALQALSTIGSGNILVYRDAGSQNAGSLVLVFAGALAGVAVNQVTVGSLLNYIGFPSTSTLQAGGTASADEFQVITLVGSANYFVTYAGQTTPQLSNGWVGFNSGSIPTSALQTALQNLSTIGANNVLVYAVNYNGSAGTVNFFLVRFTGALANTGASLMTVNSSGASSVTRVLPGGANKNEIQTVTVLGTGGTFTLSLGAQTTSAIAWNAVSGTVQTRIQTDLAATITACTVTGSGTAASPYIVTVTNPANTPIALMTGNGSLLTGGGGTIIEITHGAAGINEVQTVTEAAGINGGTFTLAFKGATTGPQAWNVAAATTLQTALRALTTIGSGNVNVSGSAGGPYTVTFVGTLAATDVPLLVGDGSLLTGATGTQTLAVATMTFSSGPNHYNDPLNWSSSGVPNTGDAVVFENGSSSCLYGLNQISTFTANAGTDTATWAAGDLLIGQTVYVTSTGTLPAPLAAGTLYYLVNVNRDAGTCQFATTLGGSPIDLTTAGTGVHTLGVRLASFEHNSRYTGNIGNSRNNGLGYFEYRPLYLHFGLQTVAQGGLQTVTIGTGNGSGNGKLNLDNDVDQANVKIIGTGGSVESGIPAMLWKGQHAANTIKLIDGDLGIAPFPGETAVFASLIMRAGTLELGPGATLTGPIDKTGGTITVEGSAINGTVLIR